MDGKGLRLGGADIGGGAAGKPQGGSSGGQRRSRPGAQHSMRKFAAGRCLRAKTTASQLAQPTACTAQHAHRVRLAQLGLELVQLVLRSLQGFLRRRIPILAALLWRRAAAAALLLLLLLLLQLLLLVGGRLIALLLRLLLLHGLLVSMRLLCKPLLSLLQLARRGVLPHILRRLLPLFCRWLLGILHGCLLPTLLLLLLPLRRCLLVPLLLGLLPLLLALVPLACRSITLAGLA